MRGQGRIALPEGTHFELPGKYCVPLEEDFAGVSREYLCQAFGGRVEMEGEGKVCLGLDEAGSFCVLNEAVEEEGGEFVFPCRGMFKHLRRCNQRYNRPGVNVFVCGGVCQGERKARGMGCE